MPECPENRLCNTMMQNMETQLLPRETLIPAPKIHWKATQNPKVTHPNGSLKLAAKDGKELPAIAPTKRKRLLAPSAPKQNQKENRMAQETLNQTQVEGLEPRASRRRYNDRDREETAFVRKIGSCIKCRKKRKRVSTSSSYKLCLTRIVHNGPKASSWSLCSLPVRSA